MTRYLECRNGSAEDILGMASGSQEATLLVTAWQAAHLTSARVSPEKYAIVLPDFLNYARMLNTGQAVTMLKLSGSLGKAVAPGIRAGLSAIAKPAAAASMDFWTIARALLAYDMALVPGDYQGEVILHSYLADLAFAFNRRDFVQGFFEACGTRRKPGIQTQQLAAALSALQRWDCPPASFHFLYSERDPQLAALRAAQESGFFERTRWCADLTNWPNDLQVTAQASACAHADSIVVSTNLP